MAPATRSSRSSKRRKPLSKIGTFGRGIKHFVSDPGSTLDEAFAVARSETEQRSTQTALEAFHQTFNFCLSCRQYTCARLLERRRGPLPDLRPGGRICGGLGMDAAVGLPLDGSRAPGRPERRFARDRRSRGGGARRSGRD